MNVYTCNKFTGHYPVGVAAVVIATDRHEAVARLNTELQSLGLIGDALPDSMTPLIPDTHYPVCRILNDGNY